VSHVGQAVTGAIVFGVGLVAARPAMVGGGSVTDS
jgi:hypothetical protein